MFHLIKALTVPSSDVTEVWMLVILRSKNNSLNKIQLYFKKSELAFPTESRVVL